MDRGLLREGRAPRVRARPTRRRLRAARDEQPFTRSGARPRAADTNGAAAGRARSYRARAGACLAPTCSASCSRSGSLAPLGDAHGPGRSRPDEIRRRNSGQRNERGAGRSKSGCAARARPRARARLPDPSRPRQRQKPHLARRGDRTPRRVAGASDERRSAAAAGTGPRGRPVVLPGLRPAGGSPARAACSAGTGLEPELVDGPSSRVPVDAGGRLPGGRAGTERASAARAAAHAAAARATRAWSSPTSPHGRRRARSASIRSSSAGEPKLLQSSPLDLDARSNATSAKGPPAPERECLVQELSAHIVRGRPAPPSRYEKTVLETPGHRAARLDLEQVTSRPRLQALPDKAFRSRET